MTLSDRLNDNMRGALLMVGAVTGFTINDAFMKALGPSMSVWQVLFLRGVGVTLVMVSIAWRRGYLRLGMTSRDRWLVLGRGLAEAGAAALFVSALFNMPLASLSAIMQALPLTVTLAGVVFLGESLGWRRSLAILVGLAGVLLIVRPGGETFTLWSLCGVGAVACVTIREIFSRMIHPGVPSLTIAAVASGILMVAGAMGLPLTGWSPIGWVEGWLLLGTMAGVYLGFMGAIAAMRVGDLAFVEPFRYMSLLVSILLGLVFFAEIPDGLTLLGAAIVVGSGIYAFWRETRLSRRAGRAAMPGNKGK